MGCVGKLRWYLMHYLKIVRKPGKSACACGRAQSTPNNVPFARPLFGNHALWVDVHELSPQTCGVCRDSRHWIISVKVIRMWVQWIEFCPVNAKSARTEVIVMLCMILISCRGQRDFRCDRRSCARLTSLSRINSSCGKMSDDAIRIFSQVLVS